MKRVLQEIAQQVYGGQIPTLEGGLVFRELSNRYGVREKEIAAAARELGVWNPTPTELEDAAFESNAPTAEIERDLEELLGG